MTESGGPSRHVVNAMFIMIDLLARAHVTWLIKYSRIKTVGKGREIQTLVCTSENKTSRVHDFEPEEVVGTAGVQLVLELDSDRSDDAVSLGGVHFFDSGERESADVLILEAEDDVPDLQVGRVPSPAIH